MPRPRNPEADDLLHRSSTTFSILFGIYPLMGELYLSSRTEVLRAMNIDTGRYMSIIGAPEEMVVWMNKILPTNTTTYNSPEDLEVESSYDIFLWWIPDGPNKGGLEKLIQHLTEKGDLWLLVKRDVELKDLPVEMNDRIKKTLIFTPELDLVPVLTGGASSLRNP